MARRSLRHLAGANDQNAFPVERAEDFTSEFNGGVTDRNSTLPDLRLGADTFGDIEGTCQHGIQNTSDRTLLFCLRVRLFQLTEDLRLAHDHRIQAGCNAK